MIHGSYAWRGGREAMLRMGPAEPVVVVLQPLFEEANRTRRVLVQAMRALAERGVGSVLPDLPGAGDSPVATEDARLEDWREAVAALLEQLPDPGMTVALRGGALLDSAATHRWRLAPESGRRLLRDMMRATALTGDVKAADLETRAEVEPVLLAGNVIHPALFAALAEAEPGGDANVVELAGSPWRRAEPGDDAELAEAIAADVAAWVETCAAR